MNHNRNPWMAVLINLPLPGLGYIFVGERMWFGILFIIGCFADLLWRITSDVWFRPNLALVISWLAFVLATSLDVYFLARAKDEKNAPRPSAGQPKTDSHS